MMWTESIQRTTYCRWIPANCIYMQTSTATSDIYIEKMPTIGAPDDVMEVGKTCIRIQRDSLGNRSTGNGNDRMAYGRHEIWHMQVLQRLLMAFFLLVKLPPFRNCLCWWVIERIFQLHTVCHSKECFETHCHLALHMCLKYGLFLCCWHLTSTGSIKKLFK